VTSPAPIEKPCQLMIAPGEFVTFRTLAFGCWKLTWPLTTWGPVGFAQREAWAKAIYAKTVTLFHEARKAPNRGQLPLVDLARQCANGVFAEHAHTIVGDREACAKEFMEYCREHIGEEITIARAGRPIARLVPIVEEGARPVFGLDVGRFDVPDDFDERSEQIERSFEGLD